MDSIAGGTFRRAGAELEIVSFGMNIFDMPPGSGEHYPEHTQGDGQEEVYVVLSGSGRIVLDGIDHPLDTETVVRVGCDVRRKLYAGEEGMRVLAVGDVPRGSMSVPSRGAKAPRIRRPTKRSRGRHRGT
jgi:uncharacterized cupin superfamily protein